MILATLGVLVRIVSNSYLNVFQKILSTKEQNSSVINFYTYVGLTLLGLLCVSQIYFTSQLVINTLIMGCLGALGNYFIIKALSVGDLSTIAPINSYKPVIAMLIGFLCLREIPTPVDIVGILLIIFGTYLILNIRNGTEINKRAIFYRVLALVFSGSEAIFIKKVILISGISKAFFLWAISGLIFSTIFMLFSKHKPVIKSFKYQLLLIFAVAIMQYSTNYVFSVMNVANALALFQLSTLFSVFLGVNIFKESHLREKLLGTSIMLIGAVVIIL